MMAYKTFKYRLVPTKEQVDLIEKTFRGCAYVYNYYLNALIKSRKSQEKLSQLSCYSDLKRLRVEKIWLQDLDIEALRDAIRRLFNARELYYSDGYAGWPRFKGKTNLVKSFTTVTKVRVKESFVHLPKIGDIRYKDYRPAEGKLKQITITKSSTGLYYVNFICRVEVEPFEQVEKEIGLDLGLKDYLVTSTGDKVKIPQNLIKSIEKLKKERYKLNLKVKGSSNYEKQRIKVCKIKEKIKYQRRDFQHKLSRKLVNENQVIISESLNIKGMLEVHYLTSSIRNSAWGLFINMLAYKAEWAGRKFQKVDRYFPSSQICYNCGQHNPLVKNLHIRMWTCPKCGLTHNRDVNAAKNILREGLKKVC